MTDDYEGIFVESLRKKSFLSISNQMEEAQEARESEQKIGTGRGIECLPLSFYPKNTQPNKCLTNVRPGEE